MQEQSIHALIATTLDACTSPPVSHELSNLTALVEQITTSLPSCAPLQAKLLSALSTEVLQAKIWHVIGVKMENEDGTCYAHGAILHRRLLSATVAMVLTLTLTTQLAGPALPLGLTTALVNKQRQLPYIASQCSHSPPTLPLNTVSLFQQQDTQYNGQHLRNWRDVLKLQLDSQTHHQRDMIMRSVAQICQDLETRCNTVEEPLLRQQEQSQGLERRVAELTEQVLSLESQATDAQLQLEGFEDENSSISDEKDRLVRKLDELEVHLQKAHKKADERLADMREDLNNKELELRSAMLNHEESIHAHDSEIRARDDAMSRLEADLEHMQKQHSHLDEQHQNLQHRFHDIDEELQNERNTGSSRAEENEQLGSRIKTLESELQNNEAELETATCKLGELQVSYQELVQSSEVAMSSLETKHVADMDAAVAKADEDKLLAHAQLQEAAQTNQQIKDVYEKTLRDLQALQATIPPLESRIQKLTNLYSEQKEELDGLRTWRRTVLESIGPVSQPHLAIRSASSTQNALADQESPRQPREHRRRKLALQMQGVGLKASTETHSAMDTAMEGIANTSFASSDSHSSQPTPKRSKPRPTPKMLSMQTPYTQKPVLTSKSVSKKTSPTKRSALRQLSPNRRHTTVGFAISEDEEEHVAQEMHSVSKRRGSLQSKQQPDFDMDDFLAGTPLTPGNFAAGTGRVPEDDDQTITEL
jgi:hypothetical protein